MDCDLIVVGAGAAGIAAGLTARAAGLSVRVLEAASRIGGRAHTVDLGGVPFDHGAHYVHHATQNPLGALALTRGERLRLDLYALDTPGWLVRRGTLAPETERAALERYYDAAFDALEHDEPDDVPFDTLFDVDDAHHSLFRAWCSAHYGVPPERLSALDAWRLEDLDHDWPVADGYGSLVASLAAGLDIALGSPAHRIQRTREGVAVETPRGSVTARAAVVTVSTEVLRGGAIDFAPRLPDEVQSALEGVVLGHAERIGFRTDGPVVGRDDPASAHVLLDEGSALQLYFHEFGDNVVTAYIAGDLARELGESGREATLAAAERALVDALGTEVSRRILARTASSWTADPLVGGGYSAARPGRAADRHVLSEPFDDRIRLAGEATSIPHFGTVHGAWGSGVARVSELLAEGTLYRPQ